MEIYQNLRKTNENKLYNGTIGYHFTIESVRLFPKVYGDGKDKEKEDALLLGLRKTSGKPINYNYALIGKKLQEEFKSDMGVSDIEELVGKDIIGFNRAYQTSLQGLGIVKSKKILKNEK